MEETDNNHGSDCNEIFDAPDSCFSYTVDFTDIASSSAAATTRGPQERIFRADIIKKEKKEEEEWETFVPEDCSLQRLIKEETTNKEKNDNEKKEEDLHPDTDTMTRSHNNCAKTAFVDVDANDYLDWKKGNWCWLLSAKNKRNSNNEKPPRKKRLKQQPQKQQQTHRSSGIIQTEIFMLTNNYKNHRDNINNNNNLSAEIDSRNSRNETIDDAIKVEEVKEGEFKPNNNNNTSTFKVEEEEQEDDENECKSNNKNISKNSSAFYCNRTDDGYESWIAGNWCWLIRQRACRDDDDENDDTNEIGETELLINNNNVLPATSTRSNSESTKDSSCNSEQYDKDFNITKTESMESGENITTVTNTTITRKNCKNSDGFESWKKGNWCWILPSKKSIHLLSPQQSPPSFNVIDVEHTSLPHVQIRDRLRVCPLCSCLLSDTPLEDGGDKFAQEEEGNQCRSNSDSSDSECDNDTESRNNKAGTNAKYKKFQNERWNKMFLRLVTYKNNHKTTNVPRKYVKDPKLGQWVRNQRQCYKKETISESRVKRLNSIGFFWDPTDTKWKEMYHRLVAYKNKHKSTNVPKGFTNDPQLAIWVSHQRTSFNKKELSMDRINLLESIGFIWDPLHESWMRMYHRLVEYKKQHLSTNVPQHYTRDPQLGSWVYNQRQAHRKGEGRLKEKRIELLNYINFNWFP